MSFEYLIFILMFAITGAICSLYFAFSIFYDLWKSNKWRKEREKDGKKYVEIWD